jgi:large subunit ribosomal protein L5
VWDSSATNQVYNECVKNARQGSTRKAAESAIMGSLLKERYRSEVAPSLMKTLNLKNVMQVPRLEKVIVNIGVGEALDNPKALDAAVIDLTLISGQKPIISKARKSIANFKLREGRAIGVKVTLRGERMWSFLDRLMNVALPRVRDFRGVSPNSFDGRGNYTLGFREQLVFPEIEYDKIDKLRGLEVTIVTTARNDDHGRQLLQMLGMPFRKEG